MSTAKLAEEIKRLLPEEKYKRIRLAIMAAATAGKSEARTVKGEIAQENRLRTGLLADGTVEFTSDTGADLNLFAWVIEYQIFQPGPVTKAVLAPHETYARPDYFVGMPDGTIDYRAGTIDDEGNATFPTVAPGEVLLRSVLRKPDGSNAETPIDPEAIVIDHNATKNIQGGKPAIGDQPAEFFHLTAEERLGTKRFSTSTIQDTEGKFCKIWEMPLSASRHYSFILDYGSPATVAANKVGSLHLAFVTTGDSHVHAPTVKMTTVGFSDEGDFVLVAQAGNIAALFHRSTNYAMMLQWRVTYQNPVVNLSDFINGGTYGALSAGNAWGSKIYGDTPPNQETKFLSGGFWVYSGTGLIFDTVLTEMQFPGSNEIVMIAGTRIDLAEFPELDNDTDPQFVRPKWNSAGDVVPIFGDAAADPQVPSVDDPVTELAGDPVLLSAGATSIPPEQIPTGIIFAEGAGTEATLGQSGTGTSNFASTNNPISGAISVEATNVQANFTTNATPTAPVTLADFTAVAIKVRLKAAMAPGHNLGMFFRKAGTIVSKTRMLPIDKSSLVNQVLGIPMSQFESSEATIDQIALRWYRSSGDVIYPGFFFDDWQFLGGIQPPPVNTDGVRSVTGDGVGGTAKDVVLTFPTPAEIGAYTKVESDPLPSTGSVIKFDRPRTYGDPSAPITTATLTEDNANFRPVTQVIFLQAATFNPPATWEKSTGSDDYDPAKINVLYTEGFSATYKRYIIDHDE